MQRKGPLGAAGVAEMTMVCTAPAITNAIYDAYGVRIYDLCPPRGRKSGRVWLP
jgi:aldehyde oxidoreductase